jgi:rSAM/selenodomain-associated transferase 1
MKNTVIVFARAPRLGTVKRRLARDIGDRAALRFHTATLTGLLRSLRKDRTFRTVLAMTPDCPRMPAPTTACSPTLQVVGAGMRRHDGVNVGGRLECVPQGHGDVGQRMHRAFRRYRKGKALLIGCDIPAANAADARAAFKALGNAGAVFGPAEDGGYWLVGMGPNRPARPFANARWSTEHALADTGANFAGRRVALIRMLRDVDSAADLPSGSRERLGQLAGQTGR